VLCVCACGWVTRLHNPTAQKTAPPFFIKPAKQVAVRPNFQWRWQFNSSSQETWESDVSCVRTGSHYRSDPVRVQSTKIRLRLAWDAELRERDKVLRQAGNRNPSQKAGIASLWELCVLLNLVLYVSVSGITLHRTLRPHTLHHIIVHSYRKPQIASLRSNHNSSEI
jgi:hypothetical protein